jgi:hypothetical protein
MVAACASWWWSMVPNYRVSPQGRSSLAIEQRNQGLIVP